MIINSVLYTNTKYEEHFKKWTFELSAFQKWAIEGIVKNKNVLITAPTGSGKTLPAEFAIEFLTNQNKKVIYTAPIKALVNEKHDSLSKKFPNISFGLLTGDNKFNPDADVLIMTTEIYRNTLFQQKIKNEKIPLSFDMDLNDLGMIIYDEIHYISDEKRGKVWEESMMITPKHVQILGLSATISGVKQFCSWMETCNSKEVYVCNHTKRVVPLNHYAFVTCPLSNFKKMDNVSRDLMEKNHEKPLLLKNNENKNFSEKNTIQIKKYLNYIRKQNIHVDKYFVINRLLNHLFIHNQLPTICFILSKKQITKYADNITTNLFPEGSKIPSIIKSECDKILINKLPNHKEFTQLHEYSRIIKYLQKGIAIHHSGITPIFREMVEKLFLKGMVPVLLATETFAIGINAPAKSTIFTSLTKYDGDKFRHLYANEYAQMSGRAGRRGIDKIGNAYHLCNLYDIQNNMPDTMTYKQMLTGAPPSVKTQFSINFDLILKLISSQTHNYTEFMQKSMICERIAKENMSLQKDIQIITNDIKPLQDIFSKIPKENQELITEYDNILLNLQYARNKQQKKLNKRIKEITQLFPEIIEQHGNYLTIKSMYQTKNKLEASIKNNDNYVKNTIDTVLNILEDNGFICKNDNYELTLKGEYATNIHEIHPLIMAEIVNDGVMDSLSETELCVVFSIFTNIRLSDENKVYSINEVNTSNKTKSVIRKILEYNDKYYNIESKHQLDFSNEYEHHFDMCDLIQDWCNAEDDHACSKVYSEAEYYGIYNGDFIKAIRKINNMVNEFENICLLQENMALLNKIKNIPSMILKSIATNQSLYI